MGGVPWAGLVCCTTLWRLLAVAAVLLVAVVPPRPPPAATQLRQRTPICDHARSAVARRIVHQVTWWSFKRIFAKFEVL